MLVKTAFIAAAAATIWKFNVRSGAVGGGGESTTLTLPVRCGLCIKLNKLKYYRGPQTIQFPRQNKT